MEIRFSSRMINLTLGLLVLVMSAIVVFSVMQPLRTEKEIQDREQAVIKQMKIIRNAELRYRQVNGEYCASIDTLAMAGFIDDSVRFIPYSNGRKFNIKALCIETQGTGERQTFMECYAFYDDYMLGLDKDVIEDAKRQAVEKGDFPGLRFGDIEHHSDNIGNWE